MLFESGLPGLVTIPPGHIMLGEKGPGLLDNGHWENILIVVISLREIEEGKSVFANLW